LLWWLCEKRRLAYSLFEIPCPVSLFRRHLSPVPAPAHPISVFFSRDGINSRLFLVEKKVISIPFYDIPMFPLFRGAFPILPPIAFSHPPFVLTENLKASSCLFFMIPFSLASSFPLVRRPFRFYPRFCLRQFPPFRLSFFLGVHATSCPPSLRPPYRTRNMLPHFVSLRFHCRVFWWALLPFVV